MNVIEHYDKLIEEGNDPVYDPEILQEYMSKWDGAAFIEAMQIDKTKNVLEIGVGTGRLALKTAPLCNAFYGIDISSKTINRAKLNLSNLQNVKLICDDFMAFNFTNSFDIVYSSLTFMHVKEKQICINKIYQILNKNGRFVLSVEKSQNKYIEYGDRKIEIYPDSPADIKAYISNSGLLLSECLETEFAYIFVSLKA